MKHVAIVMFPGYGYVNPTLELSGWLVELGHRVTYVIDERHAAGVEAVGARAVTYPSRPGRLGDGNLTGEDIGATGLAFLRESIEVILPRTLSAFRDDVPDLILYDLESFFTARSAARLWGRPTAQLFPYVASNETFSLALELFDGASAQVQRCIDLVVEQLAARGEEPDAVWPFLANFDERNIVLLPREFQPMGETFDDRYTFVGHSLATEQPDPGSWIRPSGDAPTVLITLGTEVNDRPGFFQTCRTAFGDGRWHVVLTVAPGNLPAERPAEEHIEMHEWASFRTFLPHVSAVVCHAGISTIVEALYFGKPIVVVTFTPEDKVNGARAAELGIGRTLPGEQLTAERLRSVVEEVAADPSIRRQVARMRMNMLSAGGPARAARLVDHWLHEPPAPNSGAAPALSGTGAKDDRL
jgi:MGT family glycosyltransferase